MIDISNSIERRNFMLINCPECKLQVSDKALSCPHCGYPLQPNIKQHKVHNKINKRRRLPNGFGQISEIKNRNLRKPFRAMVSVGKDSNGRPICKPLKPNSYFLTYNDAYAALVEYNKNPYDLESTLTAEELFNKWIIEYEKTVKSIQPIRLAWTYCSKIYNMRAKDIRARHLKSCMEEGVAVVNGKEKTPTAPMKNQIKSLFNLMFDYALEYELVDKNYARTFNLSEETIKEIENVKNEHIPYTDEEIRILWDHVNERTLIDIILIQCYSGWRPQELGNLLLANVDFCNWTFSGGMKTKSGIDRIVPIHTKIRPLIEQKYKEAQKLGSPYLLNYINPDARKKTVALTYTKYQKNLAMICEELKLNPAHRPHDGRKHFVTMAKKYDVDEYAIKYMVGHKITDITEKVYTQREIEWLCKEIEKIK